MSESGSASADAGDRRAPSFELPNVGPGPDPLSLASVAADSEAVVLLLQRDYHCTACRNQVRALADRYEEVGARGAEILAVVPEPRERVQRWQDSYDLPFPLLADPGASVGKQYDQPVRLGFLGNLGDYLGRMPVAVLVDCRMGTPTVDRTHAGRSAFDRPSVEEVLSALDDLLVSRNGSGE